MGLWRLSPRAPQRLHADLANPAHSGVSQLGPCSGTAQRYAAAAATRTRSQLVSAWRRAAPAGDASSEGQGGQAFRVTATPATRFPQLCTRSSASLRLVSLGSADRGSSEPTLRPVQRPSAHVGSTTHHVENASRPPSGESRAPS